jgi:hypothetical protein
MLDGREAQVEEKKLISSASEGKLMHNVPARLLKSEASGPDLVLQNDRV